MKKIIFRAIAVLLLLVVAGLGGAWFALRGSLPQLDGEQQITGLGAPVSVERDPLGVVTIRASSDTDMARALGFVHAQERFFQMDLLRRNSAGELAELFGHAALEVDRARRLHRFRHVAVAVLASLPAADREVLSAYAVGVNAGLAALDAWPFPYLLLRQAPQSWQPADSLLTVFSMYLDLNGGTDRHEQALARMHAALSPSVYRFLTQDGTSWDAALDGSTRDPMPVPDAAPGEVTASAGLDWNSILLPGSNNFALSGARSASGAALVANDMHLVLHNPGTWFRAQLVLAAADPARSYTATGVTLPGAPVLVAGSNTQVAWGYTNSYGDWQDLVRLKLDPGQSQRYLTPDGWREIQAVSETIAVAGGSPVTVEVQDTLWGPIIGNDTDGVPLVLAWTAHHPQATNLRMAQFVRTGSVAELLRLANRTGGPPQNIVAGDARGHIGWTIMGRIPRRVGYDPSLPADWSQAGTGWQGWLDAADYPRVIDPADGQLWTANARTLGGRALEKLGDGGYGLGARAGQIRDDLRALSHARPSDFLGVQLDDRAVFLARWRSLLIAVLHKAPGPTEALDAVRNWGGHASVDSVGYRLVRAFRVEVSKAVLKPLLAPVKARFKQFRPYGLRQLEGPVWRLVSKRPKQWLDPEYKNWQGLLLAAATTALHDIVPAGGALAQATWGQRNRVAIRHPLSRALPWLSRWLDMPTQSLPGDSNMPRVQGVSFGASERFAVSPGHEAEAYFHMPGGQSGHPLSPFFGAGHQAWVQGKPTPFLPGATRYRLHLSPR